MKNKLFTALSLFSLLFLLSGTAFAQGALLPLASSNVATLSKNELGLALEVDDNIKPGNSANSELVTTTTPIVNSDFEQGPGVGWSEFSTHAFPLVLSSPTDLAVSAHSGSWGAWLGGADNENSSLFQLQSILITSPTTLRLWYWIGSQEPSCGLDVGYVKLNATIVHTWNLCQSMNTDGWVPLDLNLDAYNGQAVTLMIQALTNESVNSNLFIDDVSLYQTFADVPYGYWSESFIHRLHNAGVTSGCSLSPLMYCPGTTVTRDQMAVFLLKAKHGSGYLPPAATGVFGDVPSNYWAAAWIEQLAAEAITAGCGGGNYCPGTAVTRDQMAVFLLKAEHGSNYVPPAATGTFNDVPTDYWAAAWIEQLATEAITAGCGGGGYCPTTAVTRDQMAVFLVKTFGLP